MQLFNTYRNPQTNNAANLLIWLGILAHCYQQSLASENNSTLSTETSSLSESELFSRQDLIAIGIVGVMALTVIFSCCYNGVKAIANRCSSKEADVENSEKNTSALEEQQLLTVGKDDPDYGTSSIRDFGRS